MSENVGKEVSILPFDFLQFTYSELFFCIDQIRSPNFLLQHVHKPRGKGVSEPERKHGWDYSGGMMPIFFAVILTKQV